MQTGRIDQLDVTISDTKELIMRAFVKRLRDSGLCFDIKPFRLSLVYVWMKSLMATRSLVFESVCTLKYAHDLNIKNGELTCPMGYQNDLEAVHHAKALDVARGLCRKPLPIPTRALMSGSIMKADTIAYMMPFVGHRDGGPFGVSYEFLATQGIQIDMSDVS